MEDPEHGYGLPAHANDDVATATGSRGPSGHAKRRAKNALPRVALCYDVTKRVMFGAMLFSRCWQAQRLREDPLGRCERCFTERPSECLARALQGIQCAFVLCSVRRSKNTEDKAKIQKIGVQSPRTIW